MEEILYDELKDEFYVERTTTDANRRETYTRLPLTQWNLTKEIQVFADVIKKKETDELEHAVKVVHYSLPLTFKILDIDAGKYIYLKIEKQTFQSPKRRKNPKKDWIRLFMRNLDEGTCQAVPMPNDLFNNNKSDFPYLQIVRGQPVQLKTKKDVLELWSTKKCIGTFDYQLQNRIV